MRHKFLPMVFLALPACIAISRPVDMAPAEESAGFEFPLLLPAEGARRLEGNMAAAIQLAMDDFLPREAAPPAGVSPARRCLYPAGVLQPHRRSGSRRHRPGPIHH
jgi:hypothetical protein